ncbi:hypothetical protein HN358_03945 [Candidatus Uhrbacteria bacterium]|jgi:HTH-type transcriptional regulator, sugar sensing transcriptional regulator|nr:hypothetical protein [Candidatus Uhrbacteria bacterium]MBT7716930.1 hypothetical protein [Candidatus Uhrbacteria bacterium]
MREIVTELVHLGFSEKEARVYLAALEVGVSSAQQIGEKAGNNRATTYSVLKSLIKKGLITLVSIDGSQSFRAEAPGSIIRLLDLQQKELEKRKHRAHQTIERLQVFHNTDGSKPRIRYFERVTGLRTMQAEYEMLDEDIIQIVGLDTLRQLYDPANDQEHARELKRKDRKVKTIIATSQDVSHLDELDNFEYVVVDPEVLNIKGEMTVCGDRVVMFSYSSTIIAVEVQSKEIAQTARVTLELAWNEAVRLSRIGQE